MTKFYGELLMIRPIGSVIVDVVVQGTIHGHIHDSGFLDTMWTTPHERFARFCTALARAATLDRWRI